MYYDRYGGRKQPEQEKRIDKSHTTIVRTRSFASTQVWRMVRSRVNVVGRCWRLSAWAFWSGSITEHLGGSGPRTSRRKHRGRRPVKWHSHINEDKLLLGHTARYSGFAFAHIDIDFAANTELAVQIDARLN